MTNWQDALHRVVKFEVTRLGPTLNRTVQDGSFPYIYVSVDRVE